MDEIKQGSSFKVIHLLKWAAPLLVIPLAFFAYLKLSFNFGYDLSSYLSVATSLLNGQGFVNSSGEIASVRPGYTLFLAGVLAITHGSLKAIMFSIVIYSSLLAFFVYLVTRQLSTTVTASFVVLLWIFLPGLNFWLPRQIDSFWPIFFLISWSCLLTVENKPDWSVALGLLSGIAINLMLMIKASVLPLVLFPCLGAFLIPNKPHARIKFIISCYISLFLLAFTFHFVVASLGSEYQLASNTFLFPLSLLKEHTLHGYWLFTKSSASGISAYFFGRNFSHGVSDDFPLVGFLLINLVHVSIIGWKHDKRLLTLPLIIILSLPHISVTGLFDLRPSQNLLTFSVLLMALGISLTSILSFLLLRIGVEQKKLFLLVCFTLSLSCILWYEYCQTISIHNFIKSAWILHPQKKLRVTTRGSSILKQLPAYPEDKSNLLITDMASRNGVYIETKGVQPVYHLPYYSLGDYRHFPEFPDVPSNSSDDIIFVDANSPKRVHQRVFFLLSYSALKKYVVKNEINYLIVIRKEFFAEWLNEFSGTTLEKKFKLGNIFAYIYKVESNWPDNLVLQPTYSENAKLFLTSLQSDYPERYQWYLEHHLPVPANLADTHKADYKTS